MNNGIVQREREDGILPADFIQFLSKNYKTIHDIEKKVEQFQNDPWSNFYKKFGCRNWRNLRLCSTKCDSIDSCFSDKDVKKVIRARLKPKMKKLESNERIDVDEGVLEELGVKDQNAPIDFSYLSLNFPLVYFAQDINNSGDEVVTSPISKINVGTNPEVKSQKSRFLIEGNRFPLIERTTTAVTEPRHKAKKENSIIRRQAKVINVNESNRYSESSCSDDDSSFNFLLDNARKKQNKKMDDNGNEDPPKRHLLSLTLPPLHQSVLTLLGQKSGVKPSPRNMMGDSGSGNESSSANKAKKLRRHGRKKKAKDDGKESEEKELEKPEPPESQGGKGDDELQETQLGTLHNKNGEETDNEEDKNASFAKSPSYLKQIKSLRDILDVHLRREQWSQKEMENLNEEIDKLSEGLKKYHTDFKAKSISIKEDTWLAFPRTCTRVSAKFGVPWYSKHLRDLEPVDYLRKYVTITEPRLHLYNLIYQRYRMLENPMGKTITVKSLQRALTEVLGRPFTDEEMMELQKSYLNVDTAYELDSKAFAGICAFCERIYGKYELEMCNECAVCSRTKISDKERCHIKRKDELEEMDLSYLSSKIKLGEASASLKRLITGLTKTKFESN